MLSRHTEYTEYITTSYQHHVVFEIKSKELRYYQQITVTVLTRECKHFNTCQ